MNSVPDKGPPQERADPGPSATTGESPPADSRSIGRWAGRLFGPRGAQHDRARQALLALGLYAAFAAVQLIEVMLGLSDPAQSTLLVSFSLGGALTFYGLVRSGINLKLAGDPSLRLEQIGFALCSATWSYAISGAARGAVLSVLILVLLGGMFRLSARQAVGLAFAAFALLAAAIAVHVFVAGATYDPRLDAVHLVVAALVIGASLMLPVRLGRLRSELSAQRARLQRALELNRTLATRDSLTGLLNRRAMAELLGHENPRPARAGGPTAMAMVDIDCFKRVNDEFGQATADQMLKRFAELARVELRSSDALARWGGEEFLLMMPGIRREQARTVLDRLSVRMAEGGFGDLADGLHVSFSAGVAECRDDEPYATAIERADQALFRAKRSGRNRIECV